MTSKMLRGTRAAGLSRNQRERALTKLEKRGLIERAHVAWNDAPNVLYTRPTKHAQTVRDGATTFDAVDALVGA